MSSAVEYVLNNTREIGPVWALNDDTLRTESDRFVLMVFLHTFTAGPLLVVRGGQTPRATIKTCRSLRTMLNGSKFTDSTIPVKLHYSFNFPSTAESMNQSDLVIDSIHLLILSFTVSDTKVSGLKKSFSDYWAKLRLLK